MGTIFISENACPALLADLAQAGHEIYKVKATDLVYPAIAAHPDIYMCRIDSTLLIDDAIVTEPSIRDAYEEALNAQNDDVTKNPLVPALRTGGEGHMIFQMGSIGHDYPLDVPYNAAVTEHFFLHNTELTSPELLDYARYAGLAIINVRQGYTKCSCVTLARDGIITSDEGIARTVRAYNAMVQGENGEACGVGDARDAGLPDDDGEACGAVKAGATEGACEASRTGGADGANSMDDDGEACGAVKAGAAKGACEASRTGGADGANSTDDDGEACGAVKACAAKGACEASRTGGADGAAREAMIDLLLIRKGYIALPGMEYGFIGGTCGQVEDKVYFNGNLSAHPDFELIMAFIEKRGLKPIWYKDAPLTDIGSIVYLP